MYAIQPTNRIQAAFNFFVYLRSSDQRVNEEIIM